MTLKCIIPDVELQETAAILADKIVKFLDNKRIDGNDIMVYAAYDFEMEINDIILSSIRNEE